MELKTPTRGNLWASKNGSCIVLLEGALRWRVISFAIPDRHDVEAVWVGDQLSVGAVARLWPEDQPVSNFRGSTAGLSRQRWF